MSVARFTPQAWVNDYAIEVDAEGEREWEVSLDFLEQLLRSLPDELRDELCKGHSYESDMLRGDPAAPEWVREWHGPFEVELLDAPSYPLTPVRS